MIKRTCKQCGEDFTISDSEIKFFKDKNLDLPKRCSRCRKENKGNKNTNINNTEKHNSSNKGHNKGHKKSILGSIISALLIIGVLFIGKLFNIDLNFINPSSVSESGQTTRSLEFRNDQLLEDHFLKHKDEFGYTSIEQYVEGANAVINSPDSKHKTEAEDGDEIYYNESKNEIVFVSQDGYIRTYFKPADGIEYYNRQ